MFSVPHWALNLPDFQRGASVQVVIPSKAALVPLGAAAHQVIAFFYYVFHELLSDLQLQQLDLEYILRVERPCLGHDFDVEQD